MMRAYVGSRTTSERKAHGEGLTVFGIEEVGSWTRLQSVPMTNPSFLAFGPGRTTLYTVHGDGSTVSALRLEDGGLIPLGEWSTEGRNPVHLAFNRTGRFLVVANYATGTVAALPVAVDGALGPVCSLLSLPGQPGPHRTEQPGSHPHQVLPSPDGRFLLVPDKGLDRCFVLTCDADRGSLAIADTMAARPGAGPRHAVFQPRGPRAGGSVVYICNELDSSVTTGRLHPDGSLVPVQVLSTLPANFFGASTAAGIVATPCGRYVYVSNRGHDSIAAFAVQDGEWTLRMLGWTSSGGTTPRFITLDPSGTTLFVANETSDGIITYSGAAKGALRPAGPAVETGSPVCILFDDGGERSHR